jgi:hypothetical protein
VYCKIRYHSDIFQTALVTHLNWQLELIASRLILYIDRMSLEPLAIQLVLAVVM